MRAAIFAPRLEKTKNKQTTKNAPLLDSFPSDPAPRLAKVSRVGDLSILANAGLVVVMVDRAA